MWGQRIGTQLMERMIDFAQNTAKVEILSLDVRSDNTRAIALYRHFGIQKTGTFEGYLKIQGKEISCDTMQLHLKEREKIQKNSQS